MGILYILTISFSLVTCVVQSIPQRNWDIRDGFGAFWNLIDRETESLDYLTAEVDIRWKNVNQNERASALIQLISPDSVGVEVRGPFYSHLFSISLQADSLVIFGNAVGGPMKGAIDGPLLSGLTGLRLRNFDFTSLLLGRVDIYDSELISERYLRADQVWLTYENDYSRHIILLDLHSGLVLRDRLEVPAGELLFERKMMNYVRVGTILMPRYVEIMQDSVLIELTYKSFETEKIVSFNRFHPGVSESKILRVSNP